MLGEKMEKIRFGIVGTGTIAHRFARAVNNTQGAQLVAVASRTEEGALAFSREFDIPKSFSSYEAMAQSDCIDAAYIAVPHSAHITCSMLMMKLVRSLLNCYVASALLRVTVRRCSLA